MVASSYIMSIINVKDLSIIIFKESIQKLGYTKQNVTNIACLTIWDLRASLRGS